MRSPESLETRFLTLSKFLFFSGKIRRLRAEGDGVERRRVAPRSSILVWVRRAGGFLGLVNLGIRALRDGVCVWV